MLVVHRRFGAKDQAASMRGKCNINNADAFSGVSLLTPDLKVCWLSRFKVITPSILPAQWQCGVDDAGTHFFPLDDASWLHTAYSAEKPTVCLQRLKYANTTNTDFYLRMISMISTISLKLETHPVSRLLLPFHSCLRNSCPTKSLRNLEHSIFPVYFALAYLYFNWWLYSKIRVWIYFFLDYDRQDGFDQTVTFTGAWWYATHRNC